MQVLKTRAPKTAPTTETKMAPAEAKTTAEPTTSGPEKMFDAAFAGLPRMDTPAPSAAPELTLDVALISDLVNRRTSENARETRRTKEILKATDREIAAAAEASREEHAAIQASLLSRSLRQTALASADAEARKVADAGIAPLASSAQLVTNTAARRSARLGLQSNQLEARLAQKLRDAMV